MPDSSAYATTLRAGGDTLRCYLSYMGGAQVCAATVTSTPPTPVKALAISVTSGSMGDARPGYRVVIRSSGGGYKGTVQIRMAGTLSATNLPIRETGSGSINIVSGDLVTVFDDIPPGDKLVEDTVDFDPDGLPVGDFTILPRPVPNSGGWWVGKLDSSGNADVPWRGDLAYTVDEDSGGSLTHVWGAEGTPTYTVGSSTSATPTMRWTAAGSYNTSHTVVDVDNTKSAVQYNRVRVHSDADPPYECVIEGVELDESSFSTAFKVRLFEDADLDTLPDRSPVALWTDQEGYPDTAPVAGRSHILAIGYLNRDEQVINPVSPTITFEVISPLMVAASLPGFSKVLINSDTADTWIKLKALSIKIAIIHMLIRYTWLNDAGFDLVFSGFDDALYSRLYLQKQTPREQVIELASSRVARVVNLRHGRIGVQGRTNVIPVADRAAVTVTYTMAPADTDAGADGTDGLEMIREHTRPLETFRTQAITPGELEADNDSTFARYPQSPGSGNVSNTVERLIASVAENLEWCAMLGAEANSVYQNGSLEMQHAPEVTAKLRGAYWTFLDYHREFLAFSSGYGVDSNLRAVDLSSFLWNLKGASIELDENASPRTTVRLKAATAGTGAVDDTPRTEPTPPYTPPDYVPPGYTPPSIIGPVPGWTGALPIQIFALSAADAKARRALSYSAAGINWEEINTGLSGSGISACADPFNYFRRYPLTTSGLDVCHDIWLSSAAAVTWSQVATNATILGDAARRGYKVFMSHLHQNWIMVLSGETGASVSFNAGATWTQVAIDGGTPAWGTTASRGGDAVICPHDVDHLYALKQNAGNSSYKDLYKSTDGGLTWSLVLATFMAAELGGNALLHIPYKKPGGANNEDDGTLYLTAIGQNAVSPFQWRVTQSTDGGASWTGKIDSGTNTGTSRIQNIPNTNSNLVAFTHDSTYWWIGVNNAASARSAILNSDNFGSPTTLGGNFVAFSPTPTAVKVNGWSMNPNAAIAFWGADGASGGLALTIDGGLTWIEDAMSAFTDGKTAWAEFDLSSFITRRG